MVIWHLKVVEHLDGQNIEPYAAIDEGPGDLHIADDWGTKHQEDSDYGRALELIH